MSISRPEAAPSPPTGAERRDIGDGAHHVDEVVVGDDLELLGKQVAVARPGLTKPPVVILMVPRLVLMVGDGGERRAGLADDVDLGRELQDLVRADLRARRSPPWS